jgi:hypothetical protein
MGRPATAAADGMIDAAARHARAHVAGPAAFAPRATAQLAALIDAVEDHVTMLFVGP